jgi:p-aminobenzoyl-glutamate transporter AbgT
MRRLPPPVVLFAVLVAALAVISAPASAVSCEDEFTAKTSSEWSNTAM